MRVSEHERVIGRKVGRKHRTKMKIFGIVHVDSTVGIVGVIGIGDQSISIIMLHTIRMRPGANSCSRSHSSKGDPIVQANVLII